MGKDANNGDVEGFPDYFTDFVKAFDKACALSSNALNDQMRKAFYPLFTGLQANINNLAGQIVVRAALESQKTLPEYINGEVLPKIGGIVNEVLGPILTKYEAQTQKLKEHLGKIDEKINELVYRIFDNLYKTRIEPALTGISGRVKTLEDKLSEFKNVGGEIMSLRASLDKLKERVDALYSKKPEEKPKEEPKPETKVEKPEEPEEKKPNPSNQEELGKSLSDFLLGGEPKPDKK